MTALIIIACLIVGGTFGLWFGTLRKRPTPDPSPIGLDEVLYWIAKRCDDPDKAAYLIVRRVYDGKRHIAKNPTRKLPLEKVMES